MVLINALIHGLIAAAAIVAGVIAVHDAWTTRRGRWSRLGIVALMIIAVLERAGAVAWLVTLPVQQRDGPFESALTEHLLVFGVVVTGLHFCAILLLSLALVVEK